MKIPFYISLSLLLLYFFVKLWGVNFEISNLNMDDSIFTILGGVFLISTVIYSLENEVVRKTFENAKDKGEEAPKINIRKVIAFTVVLGFIGTLFFTANQDTIDAAKEVVLVVVSFYFGTQAKS